MPLIFILDDARLPAHFGISAGQWAERLHLPLWGLRPQFSPTYPDSHQHVVAAGYCVTSGLCRSRTLLQEVTDIAHLPVRDAVVVVSDQDAERIGILPGRRLFSRHTGSALQLHDEAERVLLHLTSDAFGRWSVSPQSPAAPRIRLGLVGRETDHRNVYPATLAALGDAASQLETGLTIRFLPPAELSESLSELDDLDAVLLPGGASMSAVSGQIRVASATFRRPLPTLGLCLGMQSMATAAVRRQPGCSDAILAEVAPGASLHSFIPFEDKRHRCGLLPFSPSASLPAGDIRQMHYNHRYRFNPALRPQLLTSKIAVSAQTDDIVDAISLNGHPFWHGVQGHPELLSRPDAPHPLFIALLKAALSQRA